MIKSDKYYKQYSSIGIGMGACNPYGAGGGGLSWSSIVYY